MKQSINKIEGTPILKLANAQWLKDLKNTQSKLFLKQLLQLKQNLYEGTKVVGF